MPSEAQIRVTVLADVTPLNQVAEAANSAAERMAKSFREAGLSSENASSAMKNLGFSAGECAAAMEAAGYQAEQAAAKITALDRAEAMATARIAAMSAGVGGMGMAMGRVAAASPALAAALSAAFPVIAVAAAADVVGTLVEKLASYEAHLHKEAIEADDAAISTIHLASAIEEQTLRLGDEIEKLEGGVTRNSVAEALVEAKDKADELSKGLQADIEKLNDLLSVDWTGAILGKNPNLGESLGAGAGPLGMIFGNAGEQEAKISSIRNQIQPSLDAIEDAKLKLAQAPAGSDQERAALDAERAAYERAAAALKVASESTSFEAGQQRILKDAYLASTEAARALEAQIKNLSLSEEAAGRAAQDAEQKRYAKEDEEAKRAAETAARAREKAEEEAERAEKASGEVMERNAKADLGELRKQTKAAEELSLAKLRGIETVAAAQSKADQEAAKRALEGHQITLAEQAEELKRAETTRLNAQRAEITGEIAVTAAQPASGKAEEDEKAAKLVEQNAKLQAIEIEGQSRMLAIDAETEAKQTEIDAREMERRVEASTQAANRELESAMRIDEQKASHREISVKQEVAAEKAALEQWKTEQDVVIEAALEQALRAGGRESDAYERLTRKKEQLDQEYAEKSRQISQQVANQWDQVFARITSTLNRDITQWITGHERFSKMAVEVGRQIETAAVTSILKIGEKWAQHFIQVEVLDKLSQAQQVADEVAGAASKKAVQTAAAEASVQSSAGAGAAAAFASVMETVPFPANIALAPVVAATTLGEIEAYGSIGAFDTGGVVPSTGVKLVHEAERVLTERQNTAFERAVFNSSNTDNSSANETHYHTNVRQNFYGAEAGPSRRDVQKMIERTIRKIPR